MSVTLRERRERDGRFVIAQPALQPIALGDAAGDLTPRLSIRQPSHVPTRFGDGVRMRPEHRQTNLQEANEIVRCSRITLCQDFGCRGDRASIGRGEKILERQTLLAACECDAREQLVAHR